VRLAPGVPFPVEHDLRVRSRRVETQDESMQPESSTSRSIRRLLSSQVWALVWICRGERRRRRPLRHLLLDVFSFLPAGSHTSIQNRPQPNIWDDARSLRPVGPHKRDIWVQHPQMGVHVQRDGGRSTICRRILRLGGYARRESWVMAGLTSMSNPQSAGLVAFQNKHGQINFTITVIACSAVEVIRPLLQGRNHYVSDRYCNLMIYL